MCISSEANTVPGLGKQLNNLRRVGEDIQPEYMLSGVTLWCPRGKKYALNSQLCKKHESLLVL